MSDRAIRNNDRALARSRAQSVSVVGGPRRAEIGGSLVDTGEINGPNGARLRAAQADASISGDARIGRGGVRIAAEADANVNLVSVEGRASRTIAGREFTVSGDAQVGASANANGTILFSPSRGEARVKLGADAFAGARAGVAGTAEIIPGIRIGGTIEGRAGIGAGAGLDAGASRGVFRLKGSVAATLGLGGKLGGSVEIEPARVIAAARASLPRPVQQRLATAERAVATTVQRGRAAVSSAVAQTRTAVNAGVRQATTAYRAVRSTTQSVVASGQRLAQRATGAFRRVFSSPLPRPQVAFAMARSFFGGN